MFTPDASGRGDPSRSDRDIHAPQAVGAVEHGREQDQESEGGDAELHRDVPPAVVPGLRSDDDGIARPQAGPKNHQGQAEAVVEERRAEAELRQKWSG